MCDKGQRENKLNCYVIFLWFIKAGEIKVVTVSFV